MSYYISQCTEMTIDPYEYTIFRSLKFDCQFLFISSTRFFLSPLFPRREFISGPTPMYCHTRISVLSFCYINKPADIIHMQYVIRVLSVVFDW